MAFHFAFICKNKARCYHVNRTRHEFLEKWEGESFNWKFFLGRWTENKKKVLLIWQLLKSALEVARWMIIAFIFSRYFLCNRLFKEFQFVGVVCERAELECWLPVSHDSPASFVRDCFKLSPVPRKFWERHHFLGNENAKVIIRKFLNALLSTQIWKLLKSKSSHLVLYYRFHEKCCKY